MILTMGIPVLIKSLVHF